MLATLRDLVAHKGHANAALLNAVRRNEAAASDRELCDLLHHILLANRFWLLAVLARPFVLDDEARPSASFDELVARFASLQDREHAWLAAATDGDLERVLVHPQIPRAGLGRHVSLLVAPVPDRSAPRVVPAAVSVAAARSRAAASRPWTCGLLCTALGARRRPHGAAAG